MDGGRSGAKGRMSPLGTLVSSTWDTAGLGGGLREEQEDPTELHSHSRCPPVIVAMIPCSACDSVCGVSR